MMKLIGHMKITPLLCLSTLGHIDIIHGFYGYILKAVA